MALAALVVRIGGDLTGLNKALTQGEKDVQRVGKKLTRLGSDLTKGLTVPIVGAGVALAAAAVHVGEFADKLFDLADATGLSTNTLQEFRHVASIAGVETDALADAAIKLTSKLSSGGEQTKELTAALKRLGLSANDASGNLRPMDQLLPDIIGRLQGMTDITLRNTIAADIFGKSWAELAPVLGLGAGAMEKARREAQSLGLVMSVDALQAANNFRIKLDTLKASAGALTREIGMAVLPIMQSLVAVIQQNVVPAVRAAVQWFDDLSPTVKTTIVVVAGLVAAIGPLLVVLGTIMQFVPLIGVAFTALTGPIGLAVLAIGALTMAGIQMVKHWDAVQLQFTLAWTAMKDAAFFAVDKILAAVSGMAMAFKMTGLAADIMKLSAELRLLADDHLAKAGAKISVLETGMMGVATATETAAGAVANLGDALDKLPKIDPSAGVDYGWGNMPGGMFGDGSDSKGFVQGMENLGQQMASKFGGAFAGAFAGVLSGNLWGAAASGVMGLVDGLMNMGEQTRAAREALRQFMAGMDAFIDQMKVDLGLLGGEEAAKNARQRTLDDERRALNKQIAARQGALMADITRTTNDPEEIRRRFERMAASDPALQALLDRLKELDLHGKDWVDGIDRATDAANKFADALSNIPRVLNINALRHMVTGAGGPLKTPPSRSPDKQPVTSIQTVNIVVPGAGDPVLVAEAVGRVVQRVASRGGRARLSVAVA